MNKLSNGYQAIKNMVWSTPIQPSSYITQAAQYVQEQTGIHPADIAAKALSVTTDIKGKASEVVAKAMPTLSAIEQSVEGAIGYKRQDVVEALVNKYQDFKAATNSTENLRNTFNHIKNLDYTSALKDCASAVIKKAATAKRDFAQALTDPSLENGLKIAPYAATAVIATGAAILGYKYYVNRAPDLVSESRQANGLYNTSKKIISNTVSGVWNTVKPGLQYGLLTIGGSYAATLIAETIVAIAPEDKMVIGGASLVLAASIGTVKTCEKAVCKFKEYCYEKEIKPAFEKEMNYKLERIITGANNLQKHKGKFSSVGLFGTSAGGKSLTGKYIADIPGMNYKKIDGVNLTNSSNRLNELKQLFQNAKNDSTPTVIFIDNAEALDIPTKAMPASKLEEMRNFLSKEIGTKNNRIMLVIASKTKPEWANKIDYSLHLELTKGNRMAILKEHLSIKFSQSEMDEFFKDSDLEDLANRTDGLDANQLAAMSESIEQAKKSTDDNKLTKTVINESVKFFIGKNR